MDVHRPSAISSFVKERILLVTCNSSLPLEVLIDGVALHEIVLCGAYRANNNFLVLEGGFTARIRLFYKKLERKRLRVGARRRKAYYATIKSAV